MRQTGGRDAWIYLYHWSFEVLQLHTLKKGKSKGKLILGILEKIMFVQPNLCVFFMVNLKFKIYNSSLIDLVLDDFIILKVALLYFPCTIHLTFAAPIAPIYNLEIKISSAIFLHTKFCIIYITINRCSSNEQYSRNSCICLNISCIRKKTQDLSTNIKLQKE